MPRSKGEPVGERNEMLEKQLFGQQKTGINFDKYDDIPVETSGDNVPDGIKEFSDMDFMPPVLKENLSLSGYQKPTPVQRHAIPISMGARDLMACAQTGSGKTAAFMFPLIASLLTRDFTPPSRDQQGYRGRSKVYPQGLVLSPTRELTTQIFNESQKFTYRTGLRPVVVYGGQDIRQQFRELERGVDFIVATPGRLTDMIQRARVSMSAIFYLVFDEADRMLDMGFEPQIREIVEGCDMPWETRQTAMFSATFPKEIQRLAQDFLKNYIFLAVGRVGSSTQNITQEVRFCEENQKRDELMKILPSCDGLTLIFVETKRMADSLEDWLQREQVNATSIHGDRSQPEREFALAQFRCGRCPVLVATSVAARGLDIPNVRHVINYDMPNNIEDYVHRIGRTGRCGNTGTAIAFINDKCRNVLRDLLDGFKETNQKVEPWFESMVAQSSFGGYGGKKKSSRYGARDFRNDGAGGGRSGRGGGGGSSRFSGGGRGGGRSAPRPSSNNRSGGNDAW